MKCVLPILVFTSFLSLSSYAEVTINAYLSGSAHVETAVRTQYRHSGDCFVTGKDAEYDEKPSQKVNFNANQIVKNSNTMIWPTSISSPFVRIARIIRLESKVTDTSESTTVELKMSESRGAGGEQFHTTKCWHQDGFMTVNDGTISGVVKIQYQVPKDVWAVSVSRQEGQGVFNQYKAISSALNGTYDEGQQDGQILWVKPGQILEQEFVIPESVPGRLDLGQVKVIFFPLGSDLNLNTFSKFRSDLKAGVFSKNVNEKLATELIIRALGLLKSNNSDLQLFTSQMSILDLKRMSDELFEIAKSVFPESYQKVEGSNFKPDGLAIKTAAALASYQLTKALLEDLKGYCQQVEITLPFTGQKQKVLGLRAASFWLSRSLSLVKSYSYDGFEHLIRELQVLQKSGMTPQDIVSNKELAKKLQTSYKLLTQSGAFDQSPFNIAYVDMNRMLTVFKDLGAIGSAQSSLMKELEEGSRLEEAFSRNFVRTLLLFKKNRVDVVDMNPILESLIDLKQRQIDVAKMMTKSIRLLEMEGSDNQAMVLNQITSLLHNQLNVFEESFDVPYFEKIREEYMKTQIDNLEQSVQGCIGAY